MHLYVSVQRGHANPQYLSWNDQSSDREYSFNNGVASVKLTKRVEYPGTYCFLRGNELLFGYGSKNASLPEGIGELFQASVNADTNTVTLSRDEYCTWPLYFYSDHEKLVLASDLQKLINEVNPKKINTSALNDLLGNPDSTDSAATLFDGVRLLSRNESCIWKNGRLDRNIAETIIDEPVSNDPREFRNLIEENFTQYCQLPQDAKVAYEVSGGIDSATLPLFAARNPDLLNTQPVLATMLFPGRYVSTQQRKINDMVEFTGLGVIAYPVNENDYPLSRFFNNGFIPDPFYHYQEIYTEVLEGLAKELKNQGAKVVYTGIGGDELFETPGNYNDSAFWACQSRNGLYIAHDIWPIAPLAGKLLRNFSQHLPVTFRANKNIMRAYHQANGFPESIYNPVLNEDFADFFDSAMFKQYRQIIRQIQPGSVLASEKLVDWDDISSRCAAVDLNDQESVKILFLFYRLVAAEIILRSIPAE